MGRFDYNFLMKAASNNNYTGMGRYLSTFKFDDPNIQKQVNSTIDYLTRYGGIIEKILSRAENKDIRDNVSFLFQRMTNSYGDPRDRSNVAKDYNNNIELIGSKNNKVANYIDFTFDDDSSYDTFKHKYQDAIGDYRPSDEKSGYYKNNGKNVLRVYTKDLQQGAAFDKLTDALRACYAQSYGNVDNRVYPGTPSWVRWHKMGQLENTFISTSYSDTGEKIDEVRGLFANHNNAYSIVEQAKEVFKKLEKVNLEFPSELTTLGYLCPAQRDIVSAVHSGALGTEQANFMLKEINDYYNRTLSSISLTNYDVFAMQLDDNSQNLFEVTESRDKSDYTDMLRAAVKENRVSCVAGTSGGRVGTVITIAPALDDKGKPKGNYKGDTQLFVPDLFIEDARRVMDADPEAAVNVKRAEHITFGHDYVISANASLRNFTEDGGAILDENGKQTYLTPEQVTQTMTEVESVKQASNRLTNEIIDEHLDTAAVQERAEQYASRLYYYFHPEMVNEEVIAETAKKANQNKEELKSRASNDIKEFTELLLNSVKGYGHQ